MYSVIFMHRTFTVVSALFIISIFSLIESSSWCDGFAQCVFSN